MKTIKTYFTFIFICINIHLFAQFSLGAKTGYVKAWQEYGDAEVPDGAKIHVSRYQVSGLAYYDISKHFKIGIEPGFTQRGAACFPGFIAFLGDTKLLLNYVELPLMISATFPVFKDKFEIFGKAGYGASFLASASQQRNPNNGYDKPTKRKLDLDNSGLRRWDHGLHGSLGFGIHLGDNQLFVESGYYFGFIDVDPLNTSKNRNLLVELGYTIPL